MKTIAIIGAGRLGTALGYALSRNGYSIVALADLDEEKTAESRDIIGEGTSLRDIVRAAELAGVILLTTPDDKLEECAFTLSRANFSWKRKIVLHCSGILPAKILLPLAQRGAETASCHPVQTFPDKKPVEEIFKGIYFGLEGSPKALLWAQDMVNRLGGRSILLQNEDKSLYHAACILASNGLTALLDAAISTAEKTGLERRAATEMLWPLIQKTLHNVKKVGPSNALSGPLTRSDFATVQSHLQALEALPEIREMYRALTNQALKLVEKETPLENNTLKAWRRLLEDK